MNKTRRQNEGWLLRNEQMKTSQKGQNCEYQNEEKKDEEQTHTH